VAKNQTESYKRIVIGIAGGTGSGKTTVANAIVEKLGEKQVTLIHQDSYYKDLSHLPPEERIRVNFDHPDAFDKKLLVKHLRMLLRGLPIEKPIYDFKTHSRLKETVRINSTEVIIIEGILVLDDKGLRNLMDIKLYVDTDADIRFTRRLLRDIRERGRIMESVIQQYLEVVRPMHLEFVEPSKRYADVIIPEGGFNPVPIDLIVAKIKSALAKNRATS
jgi:uridine kinase